MLADSRATALIKNFGGQWLFLRNMKAVDPDANAFPDFDDNLREAFLRETELFLESQMREDRPLPELLTANYTFANERLARFYGIRNVYGTHFRRVESDPRRAGLLGHGSILTVTSRDAHVPGAPREVPAGQHPRRAASPPPPNVPARERRARGSARSSRCASGWNTPPEPDLCDVPPADGSAGVRARKFRCDRKWRTSEGHLTIDASGVLPDGTKFGPRRVPEGVDGAPRRLRPRVHEKLLTYAIGRATAYYDMPALRTILGKRPATTAGRPWFLES